MPKTEYRLAYASGIDLPGANNLRSRIAQILERPDFGALTILFSSEGGSTDQSLSLYNFIRSLPVQIHMHAIGHIGSAAVPVFLAGHRRTCTPLTRFFFHEYDWGFTSRQTLHRIDEAVKRLRSDVDLAREIIKGRTNATPEILQTLDGGAAPIIASAEEAKTHGFVSEVCELGPDGAGGMPVAIWTSAP